MAVPAVFVHGNPETDAVWDLLIDELQRDDVVRLSPPGFGAPVPDGFGATRLEYVDWLAGELERIDGPIDLVGHDWGAGHVGGVVTTRPELVRSWALDVAGIMHERYEWHDMAQLWRTPEVGEQTVAGMTGASLDDRIALLEGLGITGSIGRRVADAMDETMGRCILSLYRSADPEELQTVWDALPTAAKRPGLVIIAEDDHYAGPHGFHEEVAARAGARTVRLQGVGHWWMVTDPANGARVLTDFWSDLD